MIGKIIDLVKESKNKSDIVNLIEQNILLPEIKQNFNNLIQMRSTIPNTNISIDFIEAIELFDKEKFKEGPLAWPLIKTLSTDNFDKVQNELIKYPTNLSKDLFDLYNEFKIYNRKKNTSYFNIQEYEQFREIILNQYKKYML